MKSKIKIELKPETYDAIKRLTGEEKVMPSINFIKRYISMNGKAGMKEKTKQLLLPRMVFIIIGKKTNLEPPKWTT